MTRQPDKKLRVPQRRSSPGGRHLSGDNYRDVLLPVYYDVLNEHKPFREALATLQARLLLDERPEAVQDDGRRFSVIAIDPPDGSGHMPQPNVAPIPWWSEEGWWLLVDDRAAIEGFVAEWRLPLASARDVASSLAFPDHEVRLRKSLGSFYRVPEGSVRIDATPPEPFEYAVWDEPAKARAMARQRADVVYREMERKMVDAEKRWRQRGIRPLHPRHRSEEGTQTVALRLFRRAVLRKSWQEIARAEYPAPPSGHEREPVPDSQVRESVKRWAHLLGVPLPRGAN